MYKRKGDSAWISPVKTKPDATNIPEMIWANLCPVFFAMRLPINAPMQKKHIVSVKFNERTEGENPISAKGILSIDQAYKTPEKSIAKTPVAR